jgi:chromosome segregation ATPase
LAHALAMIWCTFAEWGDRDGPSCSADRWRSVESDDTSDETSGGRSVLSGLLAPLRLPERVLEALDELRPMRLELVRVRKQTEPLGDLLPALQHLEDDLGARIAAVNDELSPVRAELTRVREQTEPVLDLLPALQRLQDVLGTRLDAVHDVVVALESEESHLNRAIKEMATKVATLTDAVAPVDDRLVTVERTVHGLAGEVRSIHETLVGLKEDIQRITGLSGERGVMERARDALTGTKDEKEEDGS